MDLLAFILIAAALANLIIGFLVRLINPEDNVARTFSEMVFVIAAWVLANFFERLTHDLIFVRTCYAIPVLFPVVLLVFVSAFTRTADFERRRFWPFYSAGAALFVLSYSPWLVKNVIAPASNGIITLMGPLFPFYLAYLLSLLGYGFWRLFQAYRLSVFLRRRQLQYMFIGLAVFAGAAVMVSLLLPRPGDFRFNEIDSAASLFFIAFTAYAIINRRLLNIEVVFSGMVLTILWGGLMALLNFSFFFFWRTVTGTAISGQLFIASTAFLIGLAFLFTSFRQRLNDIVDRVVYHNFYDYETVILEAVDVLVTKYDLADLLDYLRRTISQAMGVDRVQVILERDDGWEAAQRFKEIFFLSDLAEPPSPADSDPRRFLADHQAEVYLPLIFQDDYLGCLLLGAKKKGRYSDKDRDLLTTLARQAAVAIANSRLIEAGRKNIEALAEIQVRAQYAAELADKNSRLEVASQRLAVTQQELVKASKSVASAEIILTLQHEINNPLTAILLEDWLGLMRVRQGQDLSAEYYLATLEKIQAQAVRIKDVMHKLRLLERPVEKEYLPGVSMIDLGLETGS